MQKAIGTYACKIKLNNIDKNMYIYNMIMVFKIRWKQWQGTWRKKKKSEKLMKNKKMGTCK